MMPKVWVSNIEFNDGTKLTFDKNDIVVFVGANNAGKSLSLKEIDKLLKTKSTDVKIVNSITTGTTGNEDEFEIFLEASSKKIISDGQTVMQGHGFSIELNHSKQIWQNLNNGLHNIYSLFVNLLTTEQRLKSANPPESIKLTSQPIQHFIHYLQKNDNLEQKFSNYFRQAFGTDLIVHRNAGREVPLYVGERPIPKAGEDRVSESYINDLEKLELLHLQGDGMRSYVGVLLNAFISNYSILLIDEPEAFLHPPQARLLGKMLGKDSPNERQLFLATHSEHFLKGLLDAEIKNLKIIRLQRDGQINKVSVLNSEDINNIWNDSLLRHSNVLDGLFHSKVVICESDSDSRFFSAILSAKYNNTSDIAPDILFLNCGGKHRIPTAIKALKKLNVPLKIITDFDVLNDVNPIKEIYQNLGGIWDEIENDWKLVKTEIEQKRPEFLSEDATKEINDILRLTTERVLPKQKVSDIQKVLKKVSAWTEAKEVGKTYVPRGNATQAFERIQTKFKTVGFLILEVGELESFVKSVGNHGPKWISEVLSKDLKYDPELETARLFIDEIIN